MNRQSFHKFFKTAGPAILPVIHTINYQQATFNIGIAMREGAHGVFLSNPEFDNEELEPILREVRIRFQWLWLGVIFPEQNTKRAFTILENLEQQGLRIDACWSNTTNLSEHEQQSDNNEIIEIRQNSRWFGMYFGGVAPDQGQMEAKDYRNSAKNACEYTDVVTTTGVAGNKDSDFGKIQTFREACGNHPLGVTSGINTDNISHYAPLLDAILVSTGIMQSEDIYNIDPQKLQTILCKAREASFSAN